MIAIIDYDAGNLKSVEKALAAVGQESVITRDFQTILSADKVILPGVGSFGAAMENLEKYGLVELIHEIVENNTPFLGICLGHQSIGAAFGAKIIHAKELMHGKQSLIEHDGKSVFEGIPSPVHVARYHYLAVDEKTLPDVFEILARTEDGEIMAMQHKEYPLIGIQFHPESIYTDHGKKMIENFLEL